MMIPKKKKKCFQICFKTFILPTIYQHRNRRKIVKKERRKWGGKKSENANKFSRKKIYKNQEDAFLTELGHVTADALR